MTPSTCSVIRPFLLERVYPLVVERRHRSVLLRAQAFEYRDPRVHDEVPAAGLGQHVDKAMQEFLTVMLVYTDS